MRTCYVIMLLGVLSGGASWAQTPASAPAEVSGAVRGPASATVSSADAPVASSGAGSTAKHLCVTTEVDGVRTMSYDCLSQQLAPTSIAPADGSAGNVAEGLATAPSNHVGTFNESAESIRFGSSWGKSVTPQRPAPVPAVPPR